MDALFGLPRKKSAGISFREAIHGHLFFGQQERVDEHVALATLRHKKEPKVCALTKAKSVHCNYKMRCIRCAVTSLLEMLYDHHRDIMH